MKSGCVMYEIFVYFIWQCIWCLFPLFSVWKCRVLICKSIKVFLLLLFTFYIHLPTDDIFFFVFLKKKTSFTTIIYIDNFTLPHNIHTIKFKKLFFQKKNYIYLANILLSLKNIFLRVYKWIIFGVRFSAQSISKFEAFIKYRLHSNNY